MKAHPLRRIGRLLSVLAALAWLAACARATPTPRIVPPANVEPTRAPIPSIVEATVGPYPAAPTPAPGGGADTSALPAAFLIRFDAANDSPLLLPINPASLRDLPDYPPLYLGFQYRVRLAPDGKTLAVLTWPGSENNSHGVLHLVDLATWQDWNSDFRIDGFVPILSFSPDSGTLYWVKTEPQESPRTLPQYAVYRLDLSRREPSRVALLPNWFVPWPDSRVVSAGRLWLFGTFGDIGGFSQTPPHLLALNLATGQTAADLTFAGIKAGLENQVGTDGAGMIIRWMQPGLAWDDARRRLYVVSPAGDRVTVADLETGRLVRSFDLPPLQPITRYERPPFRSQSTAAQDAGSIISSRAILSADGQRLYVASRTETGSAVRVVDLADPTRAWQVRAGGDEWTLSPDARWLALSSRSAGAGSVNGLSIFDTRQPLDYYRDSTDPLRLLTPGFRFQGFAGDSRSGYVTQVSGEICAAATTRLARLNVETLAFDAEREIDGCLVDLVLPGQ